MVEVGEIPDESEGVEVVELASETARELVTFPPEHL